MTKWMLLRHAKSDWNDSSLTDKQRPLNPRGQRAAVLLGNKLLENQLVPERILCSTALRTVQTLQGILQSLSQYSQQPVPEILYFDELYLATPETIQGVVAKHHGNRNILMCIGHNPGIEYLATQLAKQTQEMKTAHLIVFDKNKDWGNASQITEGWEMTENMRGEES